MPIILPVEFSTEVVTREDGTTYERDLITTTHPDGTKSARVATLLDRAEHPIAYAEFVMAEVVPSHEELLAEWRLTHPKPTAEQVSEAIAKRDAGEKAEAEAKPATAAVPAAAVPAQP
jgi:hypothetical protein